MAYLAGITLVLAIMGKFKMVVPDDQLISMAHVEFEFSIDDGDEVGCGEDCEPHDRCFATVSVSGWRQHRVTSSWWCYFWHKVSTSGVKILGLTFIGCT